MIAIAMLAVAWAEEPASSVKVVHWSKVQFKTRPPITEQDYPEAARRLHLSDTRCVVQLSVDAQGVPVDVGIVDCPEVFHASAVRVAMRYRCHPLLEYGVAVAHSFELAFTFRDPDPPPSPRGAGAIPGPPSPTTGAAPVSVRASETRLLSRAPLDPADIPGPITTPVRCVLRVYVDEAGVPYHVVSSVCPDTLGAAAARMVTGFRWAPVLVGGKPVPATFEISELVPPP